MKRILSVAFATFLTMTPWAFAMEMEKEGGGESKLHWHGYGEVHYNHPSGDAAEIDSHRMVWGMTYEVTDGISLHTEVDFEHAAQEIELEYVYLDFLHRPAFNVRVGTMLMPVGPLNEFHEPTLFYSVERSNVDKDIIPTTWQEGGLGVFGTPAEGLRYRAYLVSSLNAEKFTDAGIRKGRGKIAEAKSDDLAFVGRLEYTATAGLDLGLSLYQGGANATQNPALGSAAVGITEADIRFKKWGADLRAVLVKTKIDDADKISAVTRKTIGEEQSGSYIEAAYRIGSFVPFVRIEKINTQESVPAGMTAEAKNDRDILTAGLAYYPHENVALKADWAKTEDGQGGVSTQTNLGMAYMF